MPKVDLIATKDFKYNTRRLMAGDTFEARNSVDAMILTRVRKVAESPKAKRTAHKPVELPKAVEVAPVKAAPKPAAKKAPAKRKAKAKK